MSNWPSPMQSNAPKFGLARRRKLAWDGSTRFQVGGPVPVYDCRVRHPDNVTETNRAMAMSFRTRTRSSCRIGPTAARRVARAASGLGWISGRVATDERQQLRLDIGVVGDWDTWSVLAAR